jgi:flagellar basal-body rod protein FlgC
MRSLGIAASGLMAQRSRIDVIAQNIANAETTRGVDGTPYRRKTVELREAGYQPIMLRRTEQRGVPENFGGVAVAGISEDASEGELVYDPGHPDADEAGYVIMPNVRITDELVSMMEARRLFDANASVFEAVKSMLRRATQL